MFKAIKKMLHGGKKSPLPPVGAMSRAFAMDGNPEELDREAIAKMLSTSPEALEAFEQAYSKNVLDTKSENFFQQTAKQAVAENRQRLQNASEDTGREVINRIVAELLADTPRYTYDGENVRLEASCGQKPDVSVTLDDIISIPEPLRPQLSGEFMLRCIGEKAYPELLSTYNHFLEDPENNVSAYHRFRQGLDLLDLDEVVYQILGMNQNAMGHWLPPLIDGVKESKTFFQIPKTTIIKVPLPMLQMTRSVEYSDLTPATITILDEFAQKAFRLDPEKDYFIKTGTYSSKFDFRNAKVTDPKEVMEIGEYLLYLSFQASQMASPLNNVTIYGVSTTNEWVVREFIHDKEGNPTIYNGLPLHTEYRVFVDFDTKEILGMNPYWDPAVMKHRFERAPDAMEPKQIHDATIYRMHENTLMQRYHDNAGKVKQEIAKLIPHINLCGQWAIDVMQNGDDFWIIDMSLAKDSALSECVPPGKIKPFLENWLPKLSENTQNWDKPQNQA